MKNFSLKALGALLFAAGIVVAGAAVPANAAALSSATVTSSGAVSGSTNPNPIVITATFPTGSAAMAINVALPTGWSWVTPVTYSAYPTTPGPIASVTGYTPIVFRALASGGPLSSPNAILWLNSGSQIASNSTVVLTLAAGSVNVGSGLEFVVSSVTGTNPNSVIDQSSVYLNGQAPSSSFTVSFDSNGGSGAMADQSASSATALSANAFTRSGYTFAGWNTAADGSGTAYADGASYAFTSSTTLFAQWTATLANTGIDSATGLALLAGGLSLALVGAEMFMIARRKRSN